MENAELTKIVITAAVAIVLKELLSWLIRHTATLANMLKARINPWFRKHLTLLDLLLDIAILSLGVCLFYAPDSATPITIGQARELIVWALFWVAQCDITLRAWHRWRRQPPL